MRVNDFARLAAIGALLRQFSVAASPGLDAFVSRQLARDGFSAASLKSNLLERTSIVMMFLVAMAIWSRSMTQLRLLGVSGSLRRASNSTAVLLGLQDALATGAALNIFPLHAVPLYNEDDDGADAPESVRALRSAIEASDGVIMISPEYNHGMSGALKNALDWASRPYGRSTPRSKPVLAMTASPAFTGGVRAQQQNLSACRRDLPITP
jgi:NAD(P)H-dependent FMN reductase